MRCGWVSWSLGKDGHGDAVVWGWEWPPLLLLFLGNAGMGVVINALVLGWVFIIVTGGESVSCCIDIGTYQVVAEHGWEVRVVVT